MNLPLFGMNGMFDRLAYQMVKALAKAVQSVPVGASLSLARGLGFLLYCFDRRRRVAYANIKAAFGGRMNAREIKRVIRHSYRHFSQVLAEMLYFPKMDRAYLERFIEAHGTERYEKLAREKRGTMFLAAHFGNWELLQIFAGIMGYPMHVLAKEQNHTRLNDFLNELRASHGSVPILTKGMGIRELIRVLREGKQVGVLGDQGGGREGTVIRFLGRKTTAPAGLMGIAQRTGAVVLPSFSVRKNGARHAIHVTEPLELVNTGDEKKDDAENCQRYFNRLEQFITVHPEQFLWNHKRWKFCFTKRILVLLDEKAGHATQAEAVGRELEQVILRLSPDYETELRHVPVCFRSSLCKKAFFVFSLLFSPFAQSRMGCLKWFFEAETVRSLEEVTYADFVISCGANLIPLNRWLVKEFLAKNVMVMKPPFPYSLLRYDLAVLPKHDRKGPSRSSCVTTTIAPNLVTEVLLREARGILKGNIPESGKRVVSVFVGGDAKRYHFREGELKKWAEELKLAAEEFDFDFLVTTSRRTNSQASRILKEAFTEDPHCRLLVIANEKNIDHVTYAMLAHSELAVVTEDSVSMISEALSARNRVVLLRLGEGLPKKHREFQEILAKEELIHVAVPGDFRIKLQAAMRLNRRARFLEEEKQKIREALRRLL